MAGFAYSAGCSIDWDGYLLGTVLALALAHMARELRANGAPWRGAPGNDFAG
jgi:hypothetical protein